MSQAAPDPAPLDRALQRARWSVLGTLGVCVVVIALQPASPDPPLDPATTTLALMLALVSIVTRRLGTSRVMAARPRVALTLVSMLFACGIGVVGVATAVTEGARETGLLLALGGLIVALPRPRLGRVRTPDAR